jgi:hypothetical protein
MPEPRKDDSALLASIRRDKPLFRLKHQYADAFARRDMFGVTNKLRDCEETEILACCSHCGKAWYVKNRCRLRVCPICSRRVAIKRAKYLQEMTKQMKHPKLLTLTMPRWNGDTRAGISALRKAFIKLRHTKLFGKVRGGAYTVELKMKPDGWHIHLHALMDAPYLPYQKIFSAWKILVGVDAPQIDIRAATSQAARRYAAKYASKAADFSSSAEVVVEWYMATKGSRLFNTFGAWFNADLEEAPETGELEIWKPTCPYCGEESTIYMARDGPFIQGPELWRTIKGTVCNGLPEKRDHAIVKAILAEPDEKECGNAETTV